MVFYKVNAEKDEGRELSKEFGVRNYPTFIILDSEGRTIDRWLGFRTPGSFIAIALEDLADLTPFDDRVERFSSKPSARDAIVLGRVHGGRADYREAIHYYREAERLDPTSVDRLAYPIFEVCARGAREKVCTLEEAKAAADAVLALEAPDWRDLVSVAGIMSGFAMQEATNDLRKPYLEAAISATRGSEDAELRQAHKYLLVEHALYVEEDKVKALAFKRETLSEEWMENANELNSFAWWCFEQKVNLEEAEQLSRRGVELAEPGAQKAMILDTAAEICNARGEREEAARLIEQATAENPENEHYQKQLKRFQDLLAQENETGQ